MESQVAAVKPRSRTVHVPGAELHVSEFGSGEPLVLLHGWPQDGTMWDPLIPELAGRYRVIVPDLRGLGRSRALSETFDKHTLAGDILGLMDAEGIDEARIVGHDWGGWIAWLLALEHPERIRRFAALDIPPPGGTGFSIWRLPQQLVFGSYQPLIATPWLGRRLVGSETVLRSFIRSGANGEMDQAQVAGYARETAKPASARASVGYYRTFLTRELPSLIAGSYTGTELTVPGLVIMGGRSAIARMTGIPRPDQTLAVEVIEDSGHFLVDEAPGQVLEHLKPFLRAD